MASLVFRKKPSEDMNDVKARMVITFDRMDRFWKSKKVLSLSQTRQSSWYQIYSIQPILKHHLAAQLKEHSSLCLWSFVVFLSSPSPVASRGQKTVTSAQNTGAQCLWSVWWSHRLLMMLILSPGKNYPFQIRSIYNVPCNEMVRLEHPASLKLILACEKVRGANCQNAIKGIELNTWISEHAIFPSKFLKLK